MARRSYGDGSVYQEASGRWVATYEVPPKGDGLRRRVKKRAATRAEARKLLRAMRSEAERSGGVVAGQWTTRDALDSFSEVRSKLNLAVGTRDEDAYLAEVIGDELGAIRLSRLTVKACDDFLSLCAEGHGDRRPIGPAHLAKLRARLIAVLRNEMRIGNLARNVAELSISPDRTGTGKGEKGSRRALSRTELQDLLGAAADSRLILVDLCGRNALRPAESRALRWADLDLDIQELNVRAQQDRGNRRTTTKQAHNSTRTIGIDDETTERLKQWVEIQDEMRHRAGSVWQGKCSVGLRWSRVCSVGSGCGWGGRVWG